jgi:ubiquinone/menaquinone biosynthesis C-methylase UbiE
MTQSSKPEFVAQPMSVGGTGRRPPFGLDVLDRSEKFNVAVYQGFIAGAKTHWRSDLYRAVRAKAESLKSNGIDQLERNMQEDRTYFLYAWLERRLQQFKYSGRWGLHTTAASHTDQIRALCPDSTTSAQGSLAIPDYVLGPDIHQHPGGLWASVANAVAHEWYQTGASFSGVSADIVVDHYVETVKSNVASGATILDIGCTLGRTTLALKRALPGCEVEGVDILQPGLEIAREKARIEGLTVTFRVASAEKLPYLDASFDAVGAHWLFHELPRDVIPIVFAEMQRVLKPGGSLVICDVQLDPGSVVGRWMTHGNAVRNNEPFVPGYIAYDHRATLEAFGMTDVQIWDLDPEDGKIGRFDVLPEKRTHYMSMIAARKP